MVLFKYTFKLLFYCKKLFLVPPSFDFKKILYILSIPNLFDKFLIKSIFSNRISFRGGISLQSLIKIIKKTDSNYYAICMYYLLSTANISSHWIIDLCAFSTITVKNKNIISITVIAETLEKQNSSRKSFSLVAVVI